jgi:hypothetical protein
MDAFTSLYPSVAGRKRALSKPRRKKDDERTLNRRRSSYRTTEEPRLGAVQVNRRPKSPAYAPCVKAADTRIELILLYLHI